MKNITISIHLCRKSYQTIPGNLFSMKFLMISSSVKKLFLLLFRVEYQNPHEASSRSRIFLNSLVYLCMYLFIYARHVSWPNEKRYRPQIWHTYSHWPYLKTGFFVFSIKSPWRPLASKKLPCHVDFPHISSIALFSAFLLTGTYMW